MGCVSKINELEADSQNFQQIIYYLEMKLNDLETQNIIVGKINIGLLIITLFALLFALTRRTHITEQQVPLLNEYP